MRFSESLKSVAMRGGLLSSACCLFICTAGCGTAEYESKLDAAVAKLKIDNNFIHLEQQETLLAALSNEQGANIKVSFRKPTFFAGDAINDESATPRNPAVKLHPERVRPKQLMDFPGFQFCYEQLVRGDTFGLAYLYFGVQPSDPGLADRIAADVNAETQKEIPPPPPSTWSNFPVPTPEGGLTSWKKLTTSGTNIFWIEGNSVSDPLLGTFTILMREEKGVQVIVALRTTNRGLNLKQMQDLLASTAGTVRISSGGKND